MSDAPPDDAAGHRARLRARLLEAPDSLQDYEIVEYLLALSILRRDTKPLAKALMREFGGLGPIMAASPEALLRVKGMGEASVAAIRIAGLTATRMLKRDTEKRPVLSGWQALLDYLQADMAHIGIERVRVLHLNTKNVLIRDEIVSEGTKDQSVVHVSEVIARALELKSAAIILVHNHPSGDPSASKQDIAITRRIIEAARLHDISVHDHVIIGTKGHVSLRGQGLI